MARPLRHLPVIQNWDCQCCSKCCREFEVQVTEEERQRITAQGWENDPSLSGMPLFVRTGSRRSPAYRLNHHSDGRCVFLSEENRCRIHERFGSEAKPLACRVYPFVFVPAGDHWRIGLSFACPAVAANQGRPLQEHSSELTRYAVELEKKHGGGQAGAVQPALQGRQQVEWDDLFRFQQAILAIIRDRRDRFDRRLRKVLALARLCRAAQFDKVAAGRLVEFLNLLRAGLDSEVPADPAAVPPPTLIGRMLFRQVLAVYSRQDQGPDAGIATRSMGTRVRAMWRFTRGRGIVPRLHARLPQVTFEQLEQPTGKLPEAAEQVLERYYTVKVESLQFAGPTNFGLAFWDGLDALALTLPVIRWLGRAFRDLPPEQALIQAVSIVDNHFGFNPILGTRRQLVSLRILAGRGELEKLVAWYSR